MWLALSVGALFFCFLASANATEDKNETECQIETNGVCMPKGYTKNKIPKIPIKVNVTLLIEQITEVDDDHGTVDLLAYIYLYWKEERLVLNKSDSDDPIEWGNYISLNLEWMEKLWFPDLYIYRMAELKIPEVIEPYKGMIKLF